MSKFSRREFLKLTSALSGMFALSGLIQNVSLLRTAQNPSRPNILIFVFDAMSALNLSVYGYERNTTPNLERFAERATVFNAHYSAGSFTVPGTASLLTGLYPWTHRAINDAGLVARSLTDRNIFRLVGEQYNRLAFAQNLWPNYFFGQFQKDIDRILPSGSFSQVDYTFGEKFNKDLLTTQRVFDDFFFSQGTPPKSLVFSLFERISLERTLAHTSQGGYPNGLPQNHQYPLYFRLPNVMDGLMSVIGNLKPSSLAYFHLYPPHDPYNPSKQFYLKFDDGWNPVEKPIHPLGDHWSSKAMYRFRRAYDEYIATLDNEFGRLLDFLQSSGVFDTSYVVVTSDHGELLERGERGHVSPLLYEAGIRVPLMISYPGQKSRQDVYSPTISVDVAPTLAHLAGNAIPDWREGELLPVFGGQELSDRSIFTLYALKNPAFGKLIRISVVMRKGNYKLMCYRGYYQEGDKFELYDLQNDPEELTDLYSSTFPVAQAMQDELLAKLDAVNAPYKS
ncbi:MAG TPA: sulfatase-like hydrolase/transferase [Anaerolineales bacterium]|nr:sulfatase-like hydrolase/transferase [Anaerolineales bacterium]